MARSRRRLALAWATAGLLAAVVGGLWLAAELALESAPRIQPSAAPTLADLETARRLLLRHDPRRALPGVVREVELYTHDAQLLLGQALRQFLPGSGGRVTLVLQPGVALLAASLPTPAGPWQQLGPWLNLALEWRTEPGAPAATRLPALTRARLGRLPLPPSWVRWGLPHLAAHMGHGQEWAMAGGMLRGARFDAGRATLRYAWPEKPLKTLVQTLAPGLDAQRLAPYLAHLGATVQTLKAKAPPLPRVLTSPPPPLPLAPLLATQFALAHQRSQAAGADAAQENRAALMSMLLLALPQVRSQLQLRGPDWQSLPNAERLALRGREDFALHFLVSAVIASERGGRWADALGVYKEVVDAREGSGFSFNDIAADRAGTRFGLKAVRQPDLLQRRMLQLPADAELMPPVEDLPEFMTQAEFLARYGGVDAPAYREAIADIEARLDRLSLLQPPV